MKRLPFYLLIPPVLLLFVALATGRADAAHQGGYQELQLVKRVRMAERDLESLGYDKLRTHHNRITFTRVDERCGAAFRGSTWGCAGVHHAPDGTPTPVLHFSEDILHLPPNSCIVRSLINHEVMHVKTGANGGSRFHNGIYYVSYVLARKQGCKVLTDYTVPGRTRLGRKQFGSWKAAVNQTRGVGP